MRRAPPPGGHVLGAEAPTPAVSSGPGPSDVHPLQTRKNLLFDRILHPERSVARPRRVIFMRERRRMNFGEVIVGHVEILVGADTENDCVHPALCTTEITEVV